MTRNTNRSENMENVMIYATCLLFRMASWYECFHEPRVFTSEFSRSFMLKITHSYASICNLAKHNSQISFFLRFLDGTWIKHVSINYVSIIANGMICLPFLLVFGSSPNGIRMPDSRMIAPFLDALVQFERLA